MKKLSLLLTVFNTASIKYVYPYTRFTHKNSVRFELWLYSKRCVLRPNCPNKQEAYKQGTQPRYDRAAQTRLLPVEKTKFQQVATD